MDTVNDFKKLLDLDLGRFRINSRDLKNLESVNNQSEKLSKLLESNVFNQQVVDPTKTTDAYVITPFNEDFVLSNNKEIVEITSENAVDRGQQSEPTCDFKLQKSDFAISKSSIEKPSQKQSFLRKGDGIKRFNFGNSKKIDSHEDLPEKNSNKKQNLEIPLVKNVSRPFEDNAQFQVDKLKFKFKKIVPISAKQIDKTSSMRREMNHLKSNGVKNRIDGFNVPMKVATITEKQGNGNSLKSKSDDSEEIEYNTHTILIVKRIGQLEKRLLELMQLKNILSQEESDQENEDLNEKLISSQLVEIMNEISKLNDKIVPLSDSRPPFDFEEKKHSTNCLNIDTKSRDFCASETHSESMCSTLSNGDKIRLSKDHSLTYTHLNGISQTIFQDGSKVIHFPNGQIETVHADGARQIIYSNGQQRTINPDHSEKLNVQDGRVCTFYPDGTEKIEYPSGDTEYRTSEYTKRHFANGDIKTVFKNGCNETVYSNGRIRMKDQLGNVVFDRTP